MATPPLAIREVIAPIPVTAAMVDLRNFTPHLNAAPEDERSASAFCEFLKNFYGLCLEASLLALSPAERSEPPLYMSSTGDGVLIIFSGPQHALQAFCAGMVMHIALRQYCADYPASTLPQISFGIGIESGLVSRIKAAGPSPTTVPVVDTYIGNCINIAARAEQVTKTLYLGNTVLGPQIVELLFRSLCQDSYSDLERKADHTPNDDERYQIYSLMDEHLYRLCMTYVHHHVLKGIDRPLALFRLSDRALSSKNSRFLKLLEQLQICSGSNKAEIVTFLEKSPKI